MQLQWLITVVCARTIAGTRRMVHSHAQHAVTDARAHRLTGPAASQAAPVADALQPGTAAAASDLGREHVDEQHGGIVAVAAAVWPIMLCLFMCALACVTCFPFFTYVPSGGRFAASLPKVRSPARACAVAQVA